MDDLLSCDTVFSIVCFAGKCNLLRCLTCRVAVEQNIYRKTAQMRVFYFQWSLRLGGRGCALPADGSSCGRKSAVCTRQKSICPPYAHRKVEKSLDKRRGICYDRCTDRGAGLMSPVGAECRLNRSDAKGKTAEAKPSSADGAAGCASNRCVTVTRRACGCGVLTGFSRLQKKHTREARSYAQCPPSSEGGFFSPNHPLPPLAGATFMKRRKHQQ